MVQSFAHMPLGISDRNSINLINDFKHSDIDRYFLDIVIFYVQTQLHFLCLSGKFRKGSIG